MGQVFTTVSGNIVTIKVVIEPTDLVLTGSDKWEVVISSKTDHGLGSTGVPDYPYYVDHLISRGSSSFTRTLPVDSYVVELALVGQGVVDFSEFVIAAIPPTVTYSITITEDVSSLIVKSTNTSNTLYTRLVIYNPSSKQIYEGSRFIGSHTDTISKAKITETGTYCFFLYDDNNITYRGGAVCKDYTMTVVPVPKPSIFSYCYGKTVDVHCGMNPQLSTLFVGDIVSIKVDIVNNGPAGKVNAIFKIDGTAVFNDTIQSLETATGGAETVYWSPVYSGYKMPDKTIFITIESYGWNPSTSVWVAGGIQNISITPAIPSCTSIDLKASNPIINEGEKVTLTASVTPGNVSFPVTFKDRAGIVIGTCKSSGTGVAEGVSTCTFIWDSNILGKPGTGDPCTIGECRIYYVKAYAGSCTSIETPIQIGIPIRQYTFNIMVVDSVSGMSVSGATVSVSTVGGAGQSKLSDITGLASFRVDEGTINVSVSKNGYSTVNTAKAVFMDTPISILLPPIPIVPTVGDVDFVSVPSDADIYVDNRFTNRKTPAKITGLTAGEHPWELKLNGYNNSSGKVIVSSGGLVSVYITLSVSTPDAGSLNITSRPMGAEIFIDGTDVDLTTSGMAVIDSIPPGSHTYMLKMAGYQDKKDTFNIVAGQTTSLDVELILLDTIGTLEIDSVPSGAIIYIDDKDTRKTTPASIPNLTEGEHTYKTKLNGYNDISGVFYINAGSATTIHLILEKSGGIGAGLAVAAAAVVVYSFLSGKKR